MPLRGRPQPLSTIGFASLISCTAGWLPFSHGTFPTTIVPISVCNPLGGLLNAWPCALPAKAPGGTYSRFRAARMAFRRAVCRCQRTHWAEWQERLASLPRSCPRVVGWIMRPVSCGSLSPTVVADVSAATWRRHFASVGASSQSFDDEFFGEVSQRFHVIDSQKVVPGLFDAPFTPSELRRALTLCFDSAVSVDGLPYSVLKTNLHWWQSAVLASALAMSHSAQTSWMTSSHSVTGRWLG